jgi:hypothetical protein
MSTWKRFAAFAGVSVAAVSVFSLTGITSAGATTLGHVAGYSAPPSGGPTQSAAVTLVVPTITCTPVKNKGFQGVLGGVRLGSSTGSTGGGVALLCVGKSAMYQPLIQINGTSVPTTITINPGDTVQVSASESPTSSSVTLTDGAQTQTSTGSGATISGEDVGDIALNCVGAACSPVPMSGKTRFSVASINGVNLQAAGGVRGNLADAAGQVEIKTSALTGTENAFTTTWKLSCAVNASRC